MTSRTIGECCLRWTDHDSLLQGVCNHLLSSEKFADVTLYCEGVSLKCHKFILSACSPYFDQILSESPCEHPIIILKDVLYWQMQALLHFIYKGELTTDETKLTSLVQLAQSLQIKGIGEFGAPSDDTNLTNVPKKKLKLNSTSLKEMKPIRNMKDYLSGESNMNNLTDRLISLPTENQQLLVDPLAAPIDTSDFNLQETEVEYSFESESLGGNQHIHQPMLVGYATTEASVQISPPKKRSAGKDVVKNDEDQTSTLATNHIYKRYSDETLCAAIKAVVEDGIKQVDACIKYGIPFTTLTRKLGLYRACGGRLPLVLSRKKKRHRSPERVTLASVLSMDNDLGNSTNNENSLETEENVVLVIQNPIEEMESEGEPKQLPSFKQYKTYSEDNLKEAIAAVLQNGMRLQEASKYYKIPTSTLSRKIRSSKQHDVPLPSLHVSASSFDSQSS